MDKEEANKKLQMSFINFDKRLKNFERKNNWYLFATSFLLLAMRGCLLIKEDKEDDNYGAMLIPIIFNIKHGLEILLKCFVVLIGGEIKEKKDKSHNLKEIFKKLREKLKDISATEKKEINDNLNNLESLILKYQHLNFLKKKLEKEKFYIEDYDNTVFKYPENNLNIKINYWDIFVNNSNIKSDVDDILEDVDRLLDIAIILDDKFIVPELKKLAE